MFVRVESQVRGNAEFSHIVSPLTATGARGTLSSARRSIVHGPERFLGMVGQIAYSLGGIVWTSPSLGPRGNRTSRSPVLRDASTACDTVSTAASRSAMIRPRHGLGIVLVAAFSLDFSGTET